MSKWFPESDYLAAKHYAIMQARAGLPGYEQGIEKFSEYGRKGWRVFSLPKPENRQGFELRCETVRASDPLPMVP